jgi:WD40 repeat protein
VRTSAGEVELWDVPSGEPATTPIQVGGEISVMAFSPSSQRLFAGCIGGRSAVFDAGMGVLITELTGHHHDVLRAEFSADGECLVTIGYGEPIRIWNTHSWELMCPPFDAASLQVGFRLSQIAGRTLRAGWAH